MEWVTAAEVRSGCRLGYRTLRSWHREVRSLRSAGRWWLSVLERRRPHHRLETRPIAPQPACAASIPGVAFARGIYDLERRVKPAALLLDVADESRRADVLSGTSIVSSRWSRTSPQFFLAGR